ncbi:hypothetical protein OSB04_020638 [Centaurea solstitialis]|uniref:Uncharacterized protein n=1 Tax=Centaurea solstitialis TaxID=347529 RepID=A0AA38T4S0_9ASTR|nr:hypothetical protein OSB04_020638 [Centaurea solstitialis]
MRQGCVTSYDWLGRERRFQNYSRILHLMFTGTITILYTPLIAPVQLRFQNEKQSSFETHGSFVIMSVVALIIATCTSGILFYIMDHSQSFTRMNHFSLIHIMILKVVFCLSGILALLLLVITMFIPHNLIWIGYLIICMLFGVVVGCNICGYIKLRDNEGSMQLGN